MYSSGSSRRGVVKAQQLEASLLEGHAGPLLPPLLPAVGASVLGLPLPAAAPRRVAGFSRAPEPSNPWFVRSGEVAVLEKQKSKPNAPVRFNAQFIFGLCSGYFSSILSR